MPRLPGGIPGHEGVGWVLSVGAPGRGEGAHLREGGGTAVALPGSVPDHEGSRE